MSLTTGFETVYFPEIDSTNEEARHRLLANALTAPTVISAGRQTQGRGSRGRVWSSPPGKGIYFSIVHPSPGVLSLKHPAFSKQSPIFDADWSFFTRTAGLACALVLQKEIGLDIQLKPINDLYLQGRKLGGILCESIFGEAQLTSTLPQDVFPMNAGSSLYACKGIITGIGINLRQSAEVEDFCRTGEEESRQAINSPISLEEALPPAIFTQWLNRGEELILNHLIQLITTEVDSLYHRLLWEADFVDTLLEKTAAIQFHSS
jgi:biotin-(acetyl-CoA carboxylase) ligase